MSSPNRCLMKSIKLGYLHEKWQVISVRNSTSYLPGEHLTLKVVNVLCSSPEWDVTTVPLNLN